MVVCVINIALVYYNIQCVVDQPECHQRILRGVPYYVSLSRKMSSDKGYTLFYDLSFPP